MLGSFHLGACYKINNIVLNLYNITFLIGVLLKKIVSVSKLRYKQLGIYFQSRMDQIRRGLDTLATINFMLFTTPATVIVEYYQFRKVNAYLLSLKDKKECDTQIE